MISQGQVTVHPPDLQKVQAVANVSGNQIEAAIRVVTPRDGDLCDSKVPFLGEVKHFDVEHVAVDSLSVEQGQGGVPLEKLETALCVHDFLQAGNRMQRDRETSGSDSSVPGLVTLDFRLRVRARANDDIEIARQQWKKIVELLDRGFVVRIGKSDDASFRQPDR